MPPPYLPINLDAKSLFLILSPILSHLNHYLSIYLSSVDKEAAKVSHVHIFQQLDTVRMTVGEQQRCLQERRPHNKPA